ncbi:MAG: bacteriophage Gp15 family protein [Oscillospiraceae bacterium]|nr:bacteriophage Gp15 family protein [Oscillospiraceae bacterium]
MKLGFIPEKHANINGKKYALNLGFQNVMRAAALLRDSKISEEARVSTGLRLLLSPISHTRSCFLPYTRKLVLLNKIFEHLMPSADSKTSKNTKAVISLENDGALIYGAFMQTYGINLQKDKLNWREFYALLSCIPENTALFYVMKNRIEQTEESLDDGLETLFNKLIKE